MKIRTVSLIVVAIGIVSAAGTGRLTGQTSTGPGPLGGFNWIRTGGPLGGLGYDIRMRPDNPDLMFVTDGLAGAHRSLDGGLTWAPINAGIVDRNGPSNDAIPVFSLTVDPNTPDILWAGLQGITGIYRSANGGESWEKRVNGVTETGGLAIRSVVVQPGNSSVVYAAGEVASYIWAGDDMPGREFDRVQGVVYKTTDGGLNWQAVLRAQNLVRYVLIDPTDVNTLYAATGIFDREAANSDPATNTAGGVGILKSTDGGANWAPVNVGLSNLYVGSLAMHPENPQILLAGVGNNAYPTGGGIYRTANGGSTWTYLAGASIQSVDFSTGNPSVAYAAGAGEFYRSQDAGLTWIPLGEWGPAGINPGFPIDIQVDPRDALRVFVNNYGGGNFLSADGGLTWASASTGYTGSDIDDVATNPSTPATVYAMGRSGPFRSDNSGGTWTGLNPVALEPIAEGARIAVDPGVTSHVLMSSAHWGWTYESVDSGLTWSLVTNYQEELENLPWPETAKKFQGFQAITFAPSRSAKVYGGFGVWECAREGSTLCGSPTVVSILTSDDGGHTWVRRQGTALDGQSVLEIVVDPTNADVAWAATGALGVFRTTDGGGSWTAGAGLETAGAIMSLAGDPSNSSVLYAGTVASGVFKSVDGGVSWLASSVGMDPAERVNAVVVDPIRPTVVYAGTNASGVYVSTDAGVTWTLHNLGLVMKTVQTLAIAPDGSAVYAGTRGGGVFGLGALWPTAATVP